MVVAPPRPKPTGQLTEGIEGECGTSCAGEVEVEVEGQMAPPPAVMAYGSMSLRISCALGRRMALETQPVLEVQSVVVEEVVVEVVVEVHIE